MKLKPTNKTQAQFNSLAPKPEPQTTKKPSQSSSMKRPHVPPIATSEAAAASSDSSRLTSALTELNSKKRSKPSFPLCEGDDHGNDAPFRRITRSYTASLLKKGGAVVEEKSKNNEVEASESSSCVVENSKSFCCNNDVVSVSSIASVVESSCLSRDEIISRKTETSVAVGAEVEVSFDEAVSKNNVVVSVDDLACTEQLCYNKKKQNGEEEDDVVSDYSSSATGLVSDDAIYREILSSELDLSTDDYTPSLFSDESGIEFSERSVDDTSPPSRTFSLLLEYRKQFSRSTASPVHTRKPFPLSGSVHLETFEDEEEEESYKRLRERERKETCLVHDYAEFYLTTSADYGTLIFQLRLEIVNWILEQATAKEYQQETIFLGVSLLDRFLSKGYFKTSRELQILGIACLALAIRIEENQPYNCVRQRNFYIGNDIYSRWEVVAMEWLVQEVLNFNCFVPTIHNFMWFYLKAARADAAVEKKAKFLAVLALSAHEQLGHWPSTVAAGLVIMSCVGSDQIASVIKVHDRTKENDLSDCIKSLQWLLQYVN